MSRGGEMQKQIKVTYFLSFVFTARFFLSSNLESKCSGTTLKVLKSTKGGFWKPVTPKAVALMSDEEIKCLQEDGALFAKGFAAVNAPEHPKLFYTLPRCDARSLTELEIKMHWVK